MYEQQGWIKLHRKILENEFLRHDKTAFIVFVTLLLRANHKTGKLTIGRRQLAEITGLKSTTAYNAMLRLEKQQIFDRSSNNRFTVITICKWKEYQGRDDNRDDNAMTTNRQPNDNQMTHYKNEELRIKKLKKLKIKKESISNFDTTPTAPAEQPSYTPGMAEQARLIREKLAHKLSL